MGSKKSLMFGVALVMAAGLLLLTACGGGPTAVSTPPATPTPVATPIRVESPVTPTAIKPAPTPTLTSPATPKAPSTRDPQVARGEEVFQRTAGGVGCQACHGRDARGAVGPDIRGATVSRISSALGSVEQMAFIRLSPEEVQAVAAYLRWLATQP